MIEELKGECWEDFRERHGDWGRDLVLRLAREQGGMKSKELGKQAGGIDYVMVSVVLQRLQQLLEEDRELAKVYQKALTRIQNAKL
ncbi:MAG: hypothetical protein U0V70_07420 [Terriglobia bacterium]